MPAFLLVRLAGRCCLAVSRRLSYPLACKDGIPINAKKINSMEFILKQSKKIYICK
jgi:hypothetical protein